MHAAQTYHPCGHVLHGRHWMSEAPYASTHLYVMNSPGLHAHLHSAHTVSCVALQSLARYCE